MFVRMVKAATAEQLSAVRERAVAAGLAAYEEQGLTGSTLAILGPSGVNAALEQEFGALGGVASVSRATRPYRLASREFRDTPTLVKVRDAVIGGGTLTLMAGPCSIESRDQLFEVAQGVADAGATLLRGGAFKPRTSPYAFQGLGLDGLRLLAEARERTGLPMVFAVWAARRTVAVDRLLALDHALASAVADASEHAALVAEAAAERYGFPAGFLARYFDNLHYGFSDRKREGLQRYFELAAEAGIIDSVPTLEFAGATQGARG